MTRSAAPRGGLGQSKGDASEIDGKVHIASRRPLWQGDIVTVKSSAPMPKVFMEVRLRIYGASVNLNP